MTTENFTTLPEGRMVPLEGLIVRCPTDLCELPDA
jgi:hypothetical protein